MIEVRKILVPTDYSTCADAALKHALRLARFWGASIDVLHVAEGSFSYEPPLAQDASIADPARLQYGVRVQVDEECVDGVSIRKVMCRYSEATKIILDHCREEEIDLIMMGTHGHQSIERFLRGATDDWVIGKTANEVVTEANLPVFTIGPRGTRYSDVIKQILVPVDFSDHTHRLLCYARFLAAAYGAPTRLVHVVEYSEAGDEPKDENDVREALALSFDRSEGPEVPVSFDVKKGKPAKIILEEASCTSGGLILLSSHGRESSTERRLGVEAAQIIAAASCPVFTDKAFGKSLFRPGQPGTRLAGASPLPYHPGTMFANE